jgi:hypothetical protein
VRVSGSVACFLERAGDYRDHLVAWPIRASVSHA